MSNVCIFVVYHHLCLFQQHFCVKNTTNMSYVHLQHVSSLLKLHVQGCKFFKKTTHHTPHELHPLMLTFVVFSFNTKKVHNFAIWWKGTQKLALVMSYINCCFQITSSSICHFWSTIGSTSCSTSSNKIKLSGSSTTKWLDLVMWNSSP